MTEPRRPTSRRVITRITLVVLAAIAAVAVYWALAKSGTAPTPPEVTISSAPPTSSTTSTAAETTPGGATSAGVGGVRPANGCLGGPDPYEAVLPAHEAATPDQVGAAEFAVTFARWTVAYPIDPTAPTVLAQVAAPGFQPVAIKGLDDYGRTLSAAGYTTAGATPSAANQYRILSTNQDQTSLTMDLILYRESTKATGEVETVRGFTTLLLDLVDGHWQIHGSLPPRSGDSFAPRADAPWVPYVGTC